MTSLALLNPSHAEEANSLPTKRLTVFPGIEPPRAPRLDDILNPGAPTVPDIKLELLMSRSDPECNGERCSVLSLDSSEPKVLLHLDLVPGQLL